MGKIAVLLGIIVAACGGESSSGGPTAPVQCDPDSRIGTFVETMAPRAGAACPDAAPSEQLVTFATALEIPADCERLVPDTWSADQCSMERHLRCEPIPGIPGGYEHRDSMSADANGDGSVFSGAMRVERHDQGGAVICLTGYDVSFVRQ